MASALEIVARKYLEGKATREDLERAAKDCDPSYKEAQLYIQAAQELHHRDGELEIDDDAVVSFSVKGSYVAAWVWVYDDDLPQNEVNPPNDSPVGGA